VLVGLLLIFSLLITALYLTTLTADLLQHRWGGALDDSRDAVPAAVGWAALLIIFFGRGMGPAERPLSADRRALRAKRASRPPASAWATWTRRTLTSSRPVRRPTLPSRSCA
jgi:hypothetical protein